MYHIQRNGECLREALPVSLLFHKIGLYGRVAIVDYCEHRLLAFDGNTLEDGLLGDGSLVIDDTLENIHCTSCIIVLVLIEWRLLSI